MHVQSPQSIPGDAHGEAESTESSYREWFHKFKNGENNVAEGQNSTKVRNWKHYCGKLRAKLKKNLYLH